MRRLLVGTLLALIAAGCTRGGGGGSFAGSGTAPSTSGTIAPSTSSAAVPPPPPKPPRVALTQRGLAVDGKVRAILGGEVQYYRARDPQFDVAKTHKHWESALDELQRAGGTMVTTYVPWDYHEETDGQLDFSGVRDLDLFLEMCWRRGLLVTIKPGPFINSEWPNGVGSFGAVPQWWKDKNLASLARQPDGSFFSFDLLGRKEGRQPSFFAPDFRAATARWFSIVAPTIKRYIFDRPSIVLLQIDNETNFYFKSRFTTDYSDHGKTQYRDWLARKYGSLAGKNPDPPTGAGDNERVQDWFDAGQDGIAEYHSFLRATWESLGIREPDVLFTTNDSPHPMPTMDLLLWDGDAKSKAGVPSLDAYPKQFPWSFDRPLDYPFLTSFFTKRFMTASGTRGALGAELEGGLFDLPLGLPLHVPVATTDHVLLEFFGHGGVLGVVYTFRGGLNRDGSRYFGMAPLDENGVRTPRYDVFARWGLNAVNDDLLRSRDVESKVALVVGARFMGPADGVAGHPGWIQAKEAPAILGWLEDAGIEPVILEGAKVKKGDLDAYALVVHVNADAVEGDLVAAFDSYVAKGGVLLNLLHTGRHDAAWKPTTALTGGLLSDGTLTGHYEEKLGFVLPPHVNLKLPNGGAGAIATSPFLGFFQLGSGAEAIAFDRTAPFGTSGAAAGWRAHRGVGQVIHLGTSPARAFRDGVYYDVPAAEILTARSFARWVAAEAGVAPLLEVEDGKARAFARRDPSLVFVASRLDHADDVVVKLLDTTALGLDAQTVYQLVDVLSSTSLGSATGAELAAKGFKVSLPAFGTAVVAVR